eukprot:gnl/MRDRNA2_/MRDRNA2_84810_c0_seq3.p1 gnl/MRDRNA2_/MRDRNA2_84810_c0~~gnl/MRDRNA2_/MRDRNA2_84810_c0_seq3.p1  ORF type:complete len:461 (+),score=37.81 gnl/MRDRNA2_/MRDRNA2_84810_c0_seq3:152-1534(+)
MTRMIADKTPSVTSNCLPDLVHGWWYAALGMVVGIWIVSGLFILLLLVARNGRSQDGVVPLLGQARRPKMEALDGMRTLLITFTILHNTSLNSNGLEKGHLPEFFARGLWQISFFFVVSGFVMCYVAEGKLVRYNWQRGADFLAQRLVRLCPVYWLALLLTFALAARSSQFIPQDASEPHLTWPVQAALLQALIPLKVCGPGKYPWSNYVHLEANTPGWFTSAIIWCSAVFPLLFNIGPQSKGKWQVTLFALVAICLLRSVPTFMQDYFPVYGEGLDLYAFAPLRLLEMWAGMLSARLSSQLPEDCRNCSCWGIIADLSLLVCMVIVFFWILPPPAHGIRGEFRQHPAHGDYLLTALFCLVCVAYRCASQVQNSIAPVIVQKGLSGILFSWWPLVWLAEYSFSAYIFQYPLWVALPRELQTHSFGVFLHLLLCWCNGIAATFLIERPLRHAVASWLKTRP